MAAGGLQTVVVLLHGQPMMLKFNKNYLYCHSNTYQLTAGCRGARKSKPRQPYMTVQKSSKDWLNHLTTYISTYSVVVQIINIQFLLLLRRRSDNPFHR